MPQIAPPKMHRNTIKLIQTELMKKSPGRKQPSFKSTIVAAGCLIYVRAQCADCEQRDKYDRDPHNTVLASITHWRRQNDNRLNCQRNVFELTGGLRYGAGLSFVD